MSVAPATVLVRGHGVAAATAAHMLRGEGFEVAVAGANSRAPAPVVLLSDAALALMRDIFGRPHLLASGTPVMRRIVAWGDAAPVTLPHVSLVLSGAALAAEFAVPPALPPARPPEFPPEFPPGREPVFTIHGASPLPDTVPRPFGHREAVAAAVDLAAGADGQACVVEATSAGWLFLIPSGDAGGAWLLGVGGPLDALLGQSRLVAASVGSVGPVTARFETAPRLLETLTGDDWLACGTGAIAFDPICGDGTAQAAREGLLAAAVITSLREVGYDSREGVALTGHYQSMLIAAMRRHLQISLHFYRSGGVSPWWEEQAEAVAEGYAWCTRRLGALPEPRFLLRGTRLVARGLAA